jgi:hypothetical protein
MGSLAEPSDKSIAARHRWRLADALAGDSVVSGWRQQPV